jgi:hypothetical protein
VVNLFYSSIETKLPTLLFYKPDYKVTARPQHLATEGSDAEERAQLCEDALQTVVEDPRTMFRPITGLAMKDAEFRFGLVEVGYSANWIDNPNAGRPALRDDGKTELKDEQGQAVLEPSRMLKSESVYLKRIPPQNFRVSKRPETMLGLHDWCAYKEWHYVEDVKRNPGYQNTRDLKPSGAEKPSGEVGAPREGDNDKHADMVCLWKIWDLRTQTTTVIADGHDLPLIENEPYKTFPLCDLKYVDRPDDYYPIPPVFNGRKPQDEVNEIRQRQREHGRRYTRRYTYVEGRITPEEVEKLEKGGDGVMVQALQENAIIPVPDANLHPYTQETLQTATDDFHQVVGVTAEQEGISESDTATQANILNVNSQIRTTAQRVTVADWLAEIGRAFLGVIVEKMQLPFWIQQNVDTTAMSQPPQVMPGMDPRAALMPMMGAQAKAMETAQQYQEITSKDLGDLLGIDISVDVGALSPASQAQEAQAWQMVFQWLSNPATLMAMATSPAILKKLLTSVGLRSASDMAEIQKLAQMMLMSGIAAMGAGGGAGAAGEQPGSPAGIPQAPMSVQ